MTRNILILMFLGIGLLNSCISLKSEYPETTFYRFKQAPVNEQITGSVPGTLQIRDFAIGDDLDTDHLLAVWDEENRIQRYYYHRWIANCADLTSDFIADRFNTIGAFAQGTVRSSSMILPDYILEGQIIDMIAHNHDDDDEGLNYIYISIHISLIKREPLKADKAILLNKNYSKKVNRNNYKVKNIAEAFSLGMSELTDDMLMDIQEAITIERIKED
ncbi:MAG: hypothetical protein KAH48_12185 [Chlorobi bacterium]|nr:hypothetical protein [Chlorobiota bacterium]